MKKVLLVLAISLTSLVSFTQSNEKTFSLKNGSIITGTVIEEIPGKEYKVKTTDGNIFVFKSDEIEKITLKEITTKKAKSSIEELEGGTYFFNINELSLGAMIDDGDATYNVALSTINGINFNNQLFVGLGLEFQTSGIGTFVPVFLDLRLNFSKKSNTFFTFLNTGIAISGRSENIKVINPNTYNPDPNNINANQYDVAIKYQNGFIGRLGFGYKTDISEKLNGTVSLFYTAHSYSAKAWLYDKVYFNAEGIYSVIGVKLGVGIK
jgi:hypothetical protein